ncbi:carbonic anhydrase-related protein 10-like [Mytilus galloprovincialis]|uniref:carbonic anhydrase-related protein 10-like n=1 Tax=Mytilus galloprovincialis TaxID=29158 RepID=UPI003F7BF6E9
MSWMVLFALILPKSFANELGKVWGYDSHLAPEYWGKLHGKEWDLCKSGKHQSPIEIDPSLLLFDPNLTNLHINTANVNGRLETNGLDITFSLDEDTQHLFNITGGPLSYSYKITDVKFHYGIKGYAGSEHKIGNRTFPAEVHMIGYNDDVYKSKPEAEIGAKGIVIIAVFLEIGSKPNYAMDEIVDHLPGMRKTDYKDMNTVYEQFISSWDLSHLLPNTDQYITYEGSFTQPGCQETVTWIIYNKPVYVSENQLDLLRTHGKGDWNYKNTRPVQSINQRAVRTNINFKSKSRFCSMERKVNYKVNSFLDS